MCVRAGAARAAVSELARHVRLCGQGVQWECEVLEICLSPEEVSRKKEEVTSNTH